MALACGCNKVTPTIVTPGSGTSGSTESDVKVGSVIPAWKAGEFDIHFINTTTGECIFLIFPDGTQMLIDAAGSQTGTGTVGNTTNTGIRSRWDPTTESGWHTGTFIAEYLRKCMAWTGSEKLDYVLLSHFHNDHFGGANGLAKSDLSSTYTKQSLPYIMDNFAIGKMMDRGYPSYDYPFDMATKADNASNCKNYITAVKWHVANRGLNMERFVAGSSTQIVENYNAAKYPFTVQNLAVNGEVWTGSGTSTVKTFPELADIKVADPADVASNDNCPEENHTSCALKFTYGKFDLFCGGDLQYDGMSTFAWKDIETPVAKACGRVEVMKADHHGTNNTNGYGYKDTAWAMQYLSPQCWVVNSWTDGHPRQVTYEGVTGYLPGVHAFITNTCADMKAYTGFTQVKGSDGHIVVRVAEGGDTYYVYTLTDADRNMTVKQIAGPYKSR